MPEESRGGQRRAAALLPGGRGLRFSVGTNWDPDLPARLARHAEVAEVYAKLATDLVGGGRPAYILPKVSREAAARHVTACHRHGIEFTYLLNVACLNGREFDRLWRSRFDRLLDDLMEMGVDRVTVAIPYLIEVIKASHPGLRVNVSSFAQVNSVESAQRFERLGADEITLDFMSVQRDFKMMAAMVQSVDVPLQVLGNHTCLYHCPSRAYHANLSSHASQTDRVPAGGILDYCILECLNTKLGNPVELVRSQWIRPEDLWHYEEIGIHKLKLVDRARSTDWILKVVDAYAQRQTPGDNLLEILNAVGSGPMPFADFGEFLQAEAASEDMARAVGALAAQQFLLLDNRELDGFLERVKEIDCATTDCKACGICAEAASRAVKPNPTLPAQLALQYPRIQSRLRAYLNDLYSGRVFA